MSPCFEGMAKLLEPGTRVTTLMLWFIFLAIAFMYYGVVLLTTEAGWCELSSVDPRA